MKRLEFYSLETIPYLSPETDKRVAVVTGGNSGIGWHDCLQLYLHGWKVYIAGRNEERVKTAIQQIISELEEIVDTYSEEQRKNRPVGSLSFVRADFTDLASCDKAGTEILLKEKLIHLVILNAGIMGVPLQFTKDKMEVQYETNVTSQFLLTARLLPGLKAVANESKIVPRIVFLSSIGHTMARSFTKPGDTSIFKGPDFYNTWQRYAQSKMADIHLAKMFAKKYPDILSTSVHPGFIIETELYNYWKKLPVFGIFARGFFGLIGITFGLSKQEGCLSTMRAATDPSLTLEKDNGKYFTAGGPEGTPTAYARDLDNAEYTWKWNVQQLKDRGFDVGSI